MKEKTVDIDILEEYFNRICFDETNKITADLCTIGIDEIRAIENLIREYKELKEENTVLKQKIIIIRDYVKPYIVWYDLGTENYNLKGCTKQEIYHIFSKIRSEVKGEYIFLGNEEYLQSLLGKE